MVSISPDRKAGYFWGGMLGWGRLTRHDFFSSSSRFVVRTFHSGLVDGMCIGDATSRDVSFQF